MGGFGGGAVTQIVQKTVIERVRGGLDNWRHGLGVFAFRDGSGCSAIAVVTVAVVGGRDRAIRAVAVGFVCGGAVVVIVVIGVFVLSVVRWCGRGCDLWLTLF